jgi:hypothetical protein
LLYLPQHFAGHPCRECRRVINGFSERSLAVRKFFTAGVSVAAQLVCLRRRCHTALNQHSPPRSRQFQPYPSDCAFDYSSKLLSISRLGKVCCKYFLAMIFSSHCI